MLVVEILKGISEVVGLIKDSLDIVSGQQSKRKAEQEKQEQERKAAEEKIKRSLDEAQPKFYVSYKGAKARDGDKNPEQYYMCVIHLDTDPKNAFLQQIPKPTYL